MSVQFSLLKGTDAKLDDYVGERGDFAISRTDLIPRISDGSTSGGVALATEAGVGVAVDAALAAAKPGKVLAQSGLQKNGISVAATFTAVTYETNAGNIRFVSAGVHGLTTSPAVGAWVYVTWSGGTGVASLAQITEVDTTLKFTVDLPYVEGLGTPEINFPSDLLPLATVTIPAGAMGANGALVFETGFTGAAGGGDKRFEVRINGTYIDDNSVGAGSDLSVRWSIRNLNSVSAQAYQYKDAFIKTSITEDTALETDVTLNATFGAANEICTLQYYSALLWPSA